MRYQVTRDAKAGRISRIRLSVSDKIPRLHSRHVVSGLSWEKAYEFAAQLLAGTYAAGEPEAMKASYCKVKADLKNGRSGLYHTIRPGRRARDVGLTR
jgi:hypothetical protein